MISINDIKNNKLVLRDYVLLIKEIIYSMENTNDKFYNSIEESNNEPQQQHFQNIIDVNLTIIILELLN